MDERCVTIVPLEEVQVTKRDYETRFHGYLLLITAFLFYVGIDNVRLHDEWGIGDWLTNYAGGFVRRGLIGQFTLDLSRQIPHLSIYVWTLLMQLTCYAILFGVVQFLLRGLAWKLWMIAMVYSPATISFTLFDPMAGFRKEIIYLALLAAIVLLLSIGRLHVNYVALFLTLSMAALVLTHEGMLFYYPYIVCAFLIALRNTRQALLLCLPAAVVGAGTFLAAYRHPGGLKVVRAICASLGVNDITDPPCSGALIYMTKTASMAHRDVMDAISYWHLKVVMPFLLIMALGPMIAGMMSLWRNKGQRFEWWSIMTCSVSAWLFTLVLFVYAFDWNRWIYIHVFSSLILMLMVEHRHQQNHPEVQQRVLPIGPVRYATILILAASMVGWQLSLYHHFPLPGERLGFYLRNKIKGIPMHKKLIWSPPPDSSSLEAPLIHSGLLA